ncbi:transcriptional regulator, TetR family [Saccharopolyspora kobensis]|uniref:Transcriptional regulator, TetR family n=1 Tax=Saccharopolyspora kobensis TaxID=146035 RepID=A0A1H6DCE6_9PSEU|nr:TetR/AcrR family transcriptional regulator [Saccharopolyspora kobensis]SEG82991.1 transcriptional regulator, TetR family [Saccharopolyspora kobensis]SFE27530.1 transcriptional regulator, TetR family [Saccharopolyspora kobensis]
MARTREARIDDAVLAAAVDLLSDVGYRQLTMGAVAARAGVHRPAVYRRWPSKTHLVVDAVARRMGLTPTPDTGDLRNDLVTGMSTLVRALSGTPLGHALPGLIADLASDTELATEFRRRVFDARRETTANALRSAIRRGEIQPDTDVEFVLDALAAPLYYSVLFGHRPLTDDLAEQSVDLVLAAIRVR